MTSNIKKQAWIVDIIRRYHSLSLREIQEKWINNSELNPDGKNMQGRTFHRHRNEIRETYGIDIKCNKSLNKYYISYGSSNRDEVKSWILDTISIDNLLKDNIGLKDRILIDRIQSGHTFLPLIMDSMKDNKQIELTYKRFITDEEYTTFLSPYCLKAFAQRWYVVGITPRHPSEIRTYALDRVIDMKPSDIKFNYPDDFSPEDYFADGIGIFHSNSPATRIELKVYGATRNYIRTLPIHHSQVEIENNDKMDFSIFSLRVSIDEDLIREILKNGNNIMVIKPQSLKSEIISRLNKSLVNYSK